MLKVSNCQLESIYGISKDSNSGVTPVTEKAPNLSSYVVVIYRVASMVRKFLRAYRAFIRLDFNHPMKVLNRNSVSIDSGSGQFPGPSNSPVPIPMLGVFAIATRICESVGLALVAPEVLGLLNKPALLAKLGFWNYDFFRSSPCKPRSSLVSHRSYTCLTVSSQSICRVFIVIVTSSIEFLFTRRTCSGSGPCSNLNSSAKRTSGEALFDVILPNSSWFSAGAFAQPKPTVFNRLVAELFHKNSAILFSRNILKFVTERAYHHHKQRTTPSAKSIAGEVIAAVCKRGDEMFSLLRGRNKAGFSFSTERSFAS